MDYARKFSGCLASTLVCRSLTDVKLEPVDGFAFQGWPVQVNWRNTSTPSGLTSSALPVSFRASGGGLRKTRKAPQSPAASELFMVLWSRHLGAEPCPGLHGHVSTPFPFVRPGTKGSTACYSLEREAPAGPGGESWRQRAGRGGLVEVGKAQDGEEKRWRGSSTELRRSASGVPLCPISALKVLLAYEGLAWGPLARGPAQGDSL